MVDRGLSVPLARFPRIRYSRVVSPGSFRVKCASACVRLASRLMDDPLEVIGDWVDALTEQYGQDGLPPWDRYEAAIVLIEQAQRLLMPERRLRLVTE